MKLATCNEAWRDLAIEEVFKIAARIGYDGVEIAPFTIADHVEDISAPRRRQIARAAADAGVQIVGLHWLFISPKGLHLTTPDQAVRRKSADYLKSLAHFCGDLGGTVMVFGSNRQRNVEPPSTMQECWQRAKDVFASCAEACAQHGVTLCIEALSPKETNFINTVEQAVEMAEQIGHPHIDIMLDVKAMSSMPDGILGTIRRFGRRARHFHANHPGGTGVGMPPTEGDPLDLRAILQTLVQTGYDHWVSLEPFDYKPDPTTVAETGFKALKEALTGINPGNCP